MGGFSPTDPGGPSDTRHGGHAARVADAGHPGHAGHVTPLHCESEDGGQAPLFPAASLSQRPLVIRNDIMQPRPQSVITPSMLPRVSGLRVCNESDLVTRQCVTPGHILSSSSPSPSSVTPPPPFPPFIFRPAHSELLTNELTQSEGGASQEPGEPQHHAGGDQEDPDVTVSADEEDNDPYSDLNSEQLRDQEPIPATDGNKKKRKKKPTKKEEMAEKISIALAAWKAKEYDNVKACADQYHVPRTTLGTMIKLKKDKWRGRGRISVVFSDEEEDLIKRNIIERCELGVGLTITEVWSDESFFNPLPSPVVCCLILCYSLYTSDKTFKYKCCLRFGAGAGGVGTLTAPQLWLTTSGNRYQQQQGGSGLAASSDISGRGSGDDLFPLATASKT